MIDKARPTQDSFLEEFRKQLQHVDEFVALVLNGHLEIEGHLDDNVKYFLDDRQPAQLGFFPKVDLLRRDRSNPDDEAEWRMMLALNDLRNRIAHRRKEQDTFDVTPVKAALLQHQSSKVRDEAAQLDAKELIVFASALCCGFLAWLESYLDPEEGRVLEDEN
jgi:hypothetical protein